MVFWAVALIPTLLWWRDSILWVSFMSLYAIIVSHWSAYQGSRAEDMANPEVEPGKAGMPS